MYEVKTLEDHATAIKIGKFITGPYAFDQTWAPNEKAAVSEAPKRCLKEENCRYFYVEKEGEIIAAIGVRENKYGSRGYEMDTDYVAVHRDYRRLGIATQLLKRAEDYVKEKGGRYFHVLCCDIDSYKPARILYEKNGYKKVAEIPNYYVEGEGRVDYFKELSK